MREIETQSESGLRTLKLPVVSKWAMRFLCVAIIQGAIAAGLFFLGAFSDQVGLLPVAVSRVIAGGQAGNWFTVGFLTYLVVGVLGMAATSIFYYQIESTTGKPYSGIPTYLAWTHLILGNIGVVGAAFLAMWGGYWGGAMAQPTQLGGKGWTPVQVHANILQYYPMPIAAFMVIGLLGFILGGVGYIIAMRQRTIFGRSMASAS